MNNTEAIVQQIALLEKCNAQEAQKVEEAKRSNKQHFATIASCKFKKSCFMQNNTKSHLVHLSATKSSRD